jgi:acyl-coenzyme A synthetase/AMP-(fatty) acid ligase
MAIYRAHPTVKERVAAFKQIRYVESVDVIPRTPSGKILGRVLREQAGTETTPA